MQAEILHGWQDLFIAEAGASAALTGLLFVAVSINLAQILKFSHLPIRAVEALSCVLFVSTLALVPDESARLWAGDRSDGLAELVLPDPSAVVHAGLRIRERAAALHESGSSGALCHRWRASCPRPPKRTPKLLPGVLLYFPASVFSAWARLVAIQR